MKPMYKWAIAIGVLVGAAALLILPLSSRTAVDYSSSRIRNMQTIGQVIDGYVIRNGMQPRRLDTLVDEIVVDAGRSSTLSSLFSSHELNEKFEYRPEAWPGKETPFLIERQGDSIGRRYGLFEFGEIREMESP
jgi:hypothetical protein